MAKRIADRERELQVSIVSCREGSLLSPRKSQKVRGTKTSVLTSASAFDLGQENLWLHGLNVF